MKKTFMAIALICAGATWADSVYQSNFTSGQDGFAPYGGGTVKAEAGKLILKRGVTRSFSSLPEGRYRFTAKINGHTPISLSVHQNGLASYSSPLTVNGDGLLEMEYCVSGKSLQVYIFAPSGNSEYTLKSFALNRVSQPAAPDVAVEPYALEAEVWPGKNGITVKDSEASGLYARQGMRWYVPVGPIPVPRTTRPLYCYLRAKKMNDDIMRAQLRFGVQILAESVIPSRHYSWLRLGPVNGVFCGPELFVGIDGAASVKCNLDRVAWSTDPDLTARTLDKLPVEIGKKAMVTAFPATQAPVIDGNLNEDVWGKSVAAAPFLLNGSHEPAMEQTQAQFLYDNKNLYVGFTARAGVLDPRKQKLHEFKNNLRRESVVQCYTDDVVLLLVKREGGDRMYEFVVNAGGTLSAAVAMPPDYWHSRAACKSKAQTAGKIGDGVYSVELQIPFDAIGGIPRPGENLMVLCGRVEQSNKESSSFGKVTVGFHMVDNLIPLAFAKHENSAFLQKTPFFQAGSNRMEWKTDNSVFLQSTIESAGVIKNYTNPDGRFVIAAPGQLTYTLTIRDAATLDVLLRTAPRQLRTSSAKLDFRAMPETSVTLNGKPAAPGTMLDSGVNTIRVAGKNSDKIIFSVDNNRYAIDRSWLKSPDGAWSKTLLLDHSLLWPDWRKNGLTVTAGDVQQIQFAPIVPRGMSWQDYTFYVELPDGFSFEGASGYYKKYKINCRNDGDVKRGDVKFNRYAITFAQKICGDTQLADHEYAMFVIRAPRNGVGKTYDIFFYSGSNMACASEVPRNCRVSVLPALHGKAPRTIHIQMWEHWMQALDDTRLAALLAKGLKKMGVNEFSTVESERDANFKIYKLFDFSSWNFNLSGYTKDHPEHALQGFDKKSRNNTLICPEIFCRDAGFRAWFEEEFQRWHLRRGKPDIICWDFESDIFSGPLSCFDERCRTKFARMAGLSSVPVAAELKTRYREQWVEFMTSRMAEVGKFIYERKQRSMPHVQWYVYSGYQSRQCREIYGVDWLKIAKYMDFGGAGYGRPLNDVRATVAAAGEKPMLIGLIASPWEVKDRNAPTSFSAAEIMRAMLDANGGVLLYMYSTLDGRSFSALSEVSRIVAENEPFFRRDSAKTAKDEVESGNFDYEVRRTDDGALLIVCMNLEPATRHGWLKLRNPRRATDCATGKTADLQNIKLPPGGIGVYKIMP